MPEDPRPPVAIRITRPQTTEDEFLEQELETLTRTSATLLGAQPRPQGVVLRFEIVLSTGYVVMRGEGRVVGFRPNAHQGLGGLTLRFTRLDSRSKALVDKAATLRERRRPSAVPHPPEALPSAAPSPLDESLPPTAPPTPELVEDESTQEPAPVPPSPTMEPAIPSAQASVPQASTAASGTPEAPAQRDALLDRLRSRAKTLDPTAVERILQSRRQA